VDFNQLYSDHQALLMQADGAANDDGRLVFEIAASHLAGRIGCMQRALGAPAARAWDTLAVIGTSSLASPGRHLQGYAS
jgi:hypothetical protein